MIDALKRLFTTYKQIGDYFIPTSYIRNNRQLQYNEFMVKARAENKLIRAEKTND